MEHNALVTSVEKTIGFFALCTRTIILIQETPLGGHAVALVSCPASPKNHTEPHLTEGGEEKERKRKFEVEDEMKQRKWGIC